MKKRLILFIASIFLLVSANAAHSEHFIDKAGLLSLNEAAQIENRLAEVSQSHEAGIYIITVKDFGKYGYSIESAAEAIYRQLNLGYGEDAEGYLMLLSMGDRSFDLYSHGPKMNTYFLGNGRSVENSFIPSFKNDAWFVGFDKFISKVEYTMESTNLESGGSASRSGFDYANLTDEQTTYLLIIIAAILIISLIIALALFFKEKRKLNNIATATDADRYESSRGVDFSSRYDRFTHRTVQVIHHQESNNSRSGGGGGGGSHHSGHF